MRVCPSLSLSLPKNFSSRAENKGFCFPSSDSRVSVYPIGGLRNPYLDEILRFWDVKGVEEGGGKKRAAQSCRRIFQSLIGRGNLVPVVIEDLSGGCSRPIDSFSLRGLNRASLAAAVNSPFSQSYDLYFIAKHFSSGTVTRPSWKIDIIRNFYSSLLNRLTLRIYRSRYNI